MSVVRNVSCAMCHAQCARVCVWRVMGALLQQRAPLQDGMMEWLAATHGAPEQAVKGRRADEQVRQRAGSEGGR